MPNPLVLAALLACAPAPPSSIATPDRAPETPRELIVALRDRRPLDLRTARPAWLAWAPPITGRWDWLAAPVSFEPALHFVRCRLASGVSVERAISACRADPAVAWVEPNAGRVVAVSSVDEPRRESPRDEPPRAFPNDPCFAGGLQWGLENRGPASPFHGTAGADVGARAAWSWSTGSPAITLALVDTGVDPNHPELRAEIAPGIARVTAFDLSESGTPLDRYGHGTPVAGVMAALTHDGAHGDSLGVAGVCGGDGTQSGCRVLSLKVSAGERGVTSAFDLAAGVLAAVEHGARAVNVSFAGDLPSRLERLALQHAITHGCVPVVASGNQGFRDGARPQYPAAYASDGLCIQVGASDANDRRAPFSSYGPGLDLLAPGVDVWTAFPTHPVASGVSHGPYVMASGTSFAAPFVTGGVGLLSAARPELCDSDFQRLLRATAHDLEAVGFDSTTGWGRLDLGAALAAVPRDVGIWHDEIAADAFIPLESDTLVVTQGGFGRLSDGMRVRARRVRASAVLTLPDSFRIGAWAWPRIGGTTTVRGDFALAAPVPWAEVEWIAPRRARISGYVFVIEDGGGEAVEGAPAGTMLPLPADQARFGFTVIGPVERSSSERLRPRTSPPPAPATPARAHPNPFLIQTLITVPAAARIEIFDLRGTRVRRLAAGGSVRDIVWDGADERGRPLAPGLYFVRCIPGPATPLKVLRLR